jgi:chitinase
MLRIWLVLSLVAVTVSSAPENATIAAGWYTSWHAQDVPLDQLSWSKYTHLIYAFVYALLCTLFDVLQVNLKLYRPTTPNITTLGFSDLDSTLIPQFVDYARGSVIVFNRSFGSLV